MNQLDSDRARSVAVQVASFLVVAALAAAALKHGVLLVGVLAACLGFLVTGALSRLTVRGRPMRLGLASAVVIVAPLAGLAVLLLNAKGITTSLFAQFPELMQQMAKTVLEFREKLPPSLAEYVPEGAMDVQAWLAAYLKSKAQAMASTGQVFLGGVLLAYVGLVIGALVAYAGPGDSKGELAVAMRRRGAAFTDAFRQIVAAQFWIAAFNALCTALFLFGVLPFFDVELPYSGALVALTFFAGLVPIVGNLLCNGVLTLVGTSVSPMVGLSCLSFLIAIHKFEYVINAKVVGSRTSTKAWELLAVMFIAESLFGIGGLVAAPLYYAYVKKELRDLGLV